MPKPQGDQPKICIVTITGADRVGIIAKLAIGVVNHKTTGVRVIPAPGKKAGDIIHFGGLLGSAPVMKVANVASPAFLSRGGRIPSPIHGLRN